MSKFWRELSNAKFLRGDNKYVEVCTKQIFSKKKVIINLTPPPMPVANSEEVKNKCSIALGDST